MKTQILKNYNREMEKLYKMEKLPTDENKIERLLQNNNIHYALYHDTIDKIVEIWNKYEGKQFGEKTKEKIQKEIEEFFDDSIFVCIGSSIWVSNRDTTKKYSGNIKYEAGCEVYMLDCNNRIRKIKREETHICYVYIKNIEIAAKKIILQHKRARELQEELREIHNYIFDSSSQKIKAVEWCNCVDWRLI